MANVTENNEAGRPSTFTGIDRLADQQIKEILDKIAESVDNPTLKIVVSGKTGVGKSSLILGLFLSEGEAFRKPERTNTLLVRERQIFSPSGKSINLELTDTPGTEALVGVGNKSQRAQYLKAVSEAFRNADILLLCVRMDDDVREEEVQMINFFYKTFGDILWAKVVFILTFANRVTVDCRNEEDKEHEYTERFQEMKAALQVAMTQAGVRADMVTATPVCVAGHPEKKQLPNSEDWACSFLVDLLKSGIAENVKFALLNATWKRWLVNPVPASAGAAGATGFLTGVGFITAGGVISSAIITLPLGIPLMFIGGGTTIFSVGATAYQAAKSFKQQKRDFEVPQKVIKLQQGNPPE